MRNTQQEIIDLSIRLTDSRHTKLKNHLKERREISIWIEQLSGETVERLRDFKVAEVTGRINPLLDRADTTQAELETLLAEVKAIVKGVGILPTAS